jgi:hypothetical protein
MTRAPTVILVVAVAAAAYVIATRHSPTRQPPSTENSSAASVATRAAAPSISPDTPSEAPPRIQLSDEQRAVAIKHAISKALADSRDEFAKGLAASGLASADSRPIAQRFVDGMADCLFEAARNEYAARGVGFKEFLDGAEIVWSQPIEVDAKSVSRIQSVASPCIANASQQAGIPTPIDYGSAADHVAARLSAGLESPPWAAEMEARIRDHIARHPGVAGTLIKCRNDGCNVMLEGAAIRVFDLEFDRFAEQNGFRHAVLGGHTNSRRFVWLQR